MKFRHLLLLCSAAALPQLAAADLAVTNPAGLGQMHALLDFCSKSDPQNSASFQGEWQSIVGSQASLLAGLEQNSAYKQQYDDFTSELQRLPKGETHTVCAVSAAVWHGAGQRHDGDRGKDDQDHKNPDPGNDDQDHKKPDPAHKPVHESDR
jgi:hypothetical protein